ncbi:MAG TPA: glycosyltransferase family 4 protein [Mobilitalea sp.]|nr:glycosyltransferase family 4 protein [Mobilitalea sp.]
MYSDRNHNTQDKTAKKNLLIYAHYYYPDVASTGQILKELAEGLTDSFHVTVISVVPSYTGVIDPRYKTQSYFHENINGVDVLRVKTTEFSKGNKLSRIKNILTYFFRAIRATGKVGRIDYVYTISQPPILGGILGVVGKWLKHAKLIYNIQDFNPEQIMAVNYSKNKLLLKFMKELDKFCCQRANRVIVVGRDMVETLKRRFNGKKVPNYCFINNWIDEKEIYPLEESNDRVTEFKRKYGLEGKFVIMYSGNLGLYYDLENLMVVIEKFKDLKDTVFAFVGDGSVRERLVQYKETHEMGNVVFIPYQDKEALIYSLNAGNVHWVVNAKGIKGVSVPSKLYGVMATGKPVIGVLEEGSEARIIIEETGCGYVVEPSNYAGIENIIRKILDDRNSKGMDMDYLAEMGRQGREYLARNLTKDISIIKYKNAILGS